MPCLYRARYWRMVSPFTKITIQILSELLCKFFRHGRSSRGFGKRKAFLFGISNLAGAMEALAVKWADFYKTARWQRLRRLHCESAHWGAFYLERGRVTARDGR